MFLNIKIVIFALLLLTVMSGCDEMTIRIESLPENTPPGQSIYISGNFNNWDPGDPRFIMQRNPDSVLEITLPRGIGKVEYKFTRGDWSTVEKDYCGYEIDNRQTFYGREKIVSVVIEGWNDLPKPNCPKAFLIINSLPASTPDNTVLYIAGNFNSWNPGDLGWQLSRSPEGRYYIEIPRPDDEPFEYKITRGDWRRVESRANGDDIDNRVFEGKAGDVVYIDIDGWKDR